MIIRNMLCVAFVGLGLTVVGCDKPAEKKDEKAEKKDDESTKDKKAEKNEKDDEKEKKAEKKVDPDAVKKLVEDLADSKKRAAATTELTALGAKAVR